MSDVMVVFRLKGRALACALGAVVVMGCALIFSGLPFSAKHVCDLSGCRILDLVLPAWPAEGVATLNELNEAGRRHYHYFLIADLLFIAIYTMAFVSAISAFRCRAALVWLPVAAAVFDLVEDASVFVVLRTLPQPPPVVQAVASLSGALKFVGFWLSAALVVGLTYRLVVRRKRVRDDEN